MHIDADFILQILPHAQIKGLFPVDANFSVDTRNLNKGDIFVALPGEQVDGHDFIEQAFLKDTSGIIANKIHQTTLTKKYKKELETKAIIFVDDTKQALIDLAYSWRSQFICPVVAITGSVGKTTTKEMVSNILKQTRLQYLVSSGNQNTAIGVALNILKMKESHQVCVFELGISEKGAMKKLVELLRPTYSLITFVGHGHMQGLGTVEEVAHEKREVFAMFSPENIGIINGDQSILSEISYAHPVIRFGKKTRNQIQARKIVIHNNSISFVAKIYEKKYSVVLSSCNQARVTNALAAIAIGKLLQISDELLIKGVEQPVIVEGRFQVLPHTSGSVLIHDGYNSNPESVKASLVAFENYQTPLKKVVVVGDMKELGDQTMFWHRQLGRMMNKVSHLDSVILIGSYVEWTKKTLPIGINFYKFDTAQQAFDQLKSMLLQKDKVFLFKASHSIGFSELVEQLQKV